MDKAVKWNFMDLQNHLKTSIEETTFLLTYGTQAMILAEIGYPSYQVVHYTSEDDHLSLKNNLDLLEETCLTPIIRNGAYQCRTTCYHYLRVKNVIFKLRDLVLRKLKATYNRESRGKLTPKWNGPFKITTIVKANTYHLQDMKGKRFSWAWHSDHLKLYHS